MSSSEFLNNLRVTEWDRFVGQEQVKKALLIAIESSQIRKEPMEHTLFYGPPGLGKTTLAHLVSKSMGANIRITSGPTITRAGDLASILSGLNEGDVLFIDEIHRLPKVVEETLYSVMEDFVLDVMLGKGPAARSLRLELPKFTLVGATTKIGMIAAPLMDRFGMVHRMDFYSPEELSIILKNAATILEIQLNDDAILEVASRSRLTARVALKLLRRVRDYVLVKGNKVADLLSTKEALDLHQIDELGLTNQDRNLLLSIIQKHDGGPVGLETIAALLNEDVVTIQDVYEPFLMRLGLLKRTQRGRVVTRMAYDHLGITPRA